MHVKLFSRWQKFGVINFIFSKKSVTILVALLCVQLAVAGHKQSYDGRWQFGFDLGGGINYYQPTDNVINMHHPGHASFAWGAHFIKPVNRYVAIKVGYMNFGNYQNDGNGQAFCNTKGECDYHNAKIINGVFATKLNINNAVLDQAYYLAGRFQYPFKDQSIYMTLGLAYTIAKIQSYVTVDPTVVHIGPTFNIEEHIKNHAKILPILGLGWLVKLNPNVNFAVNATWNYKVKMYRADDAHDGDLYPASITVALNRSFG